MVADYDEWYSYGGFARTLAKSSYSIISDPLYDFPEDKASDASYVQRPNYKYE
jgi:hypothetical protein